MDSPDLVAFFGPVQLQDWAESSGGGCKIKFWIDDTRKMLDTFETATLRRGKTAGHRYTLFVADETGEHPLYVTEAQLAGASWTHKGGAVVAFWLPDPEALEPFKEMNTRTTKDDGESLYVTLVEMDDQDKPVNQRKRARVEEAEKGGAKSIRAARLCLEPDFHAYLIEKGVISPESCADKRCRDIEAAEYVRSVCNIESRAMLDHNKLAWAAFSDLILRPFLRWGGGD